MPKKSEKLNPAITSKVKNEHTTDPTLPETDLFPIVGI